MHRADQGCPPAGSAAKTSRPSIDRSAKSSPSLQRSASVTATHSTSFAVRRSRSKHIRSQVSIGRSPDMISPEEYASLPASIQRKYFSSKERLCIAQQSAAQGRKKQHGELGSWLSAGSTTDLLHTRPSTSAGLHSLKPKSRTHPPKPFLVRFDEDSVSEEEARWFLSLPEKVKTKRFSREELVSLTAISHRVLGKASGESKRGTAQRRRSVHRLESSACSSIGTVLPSSNTSTTESNKVRTPPPATGEAEQAQPAAFKPSRSPTEVVQISKIKHPFHNQLPPETSQGIEAATSASDAEMEILELYLQRRTLKTTASDSRIKRSPSDSSPASSTQPMKKRSHHRLHMLTPLPLPPPVLASAPSTQISTPFSSTARLSRPFLNNDPFALDGKAQSYEKQPNAGVQILDEAPGIVIHDEGPIFELRANEDPPPISTDEDCPYPHLVSSFSDDGTEDCEKEVDDNLDAESVETVGPRTPSPLDRRDGAVQQATGDSGIDLPKFHLDARSKSTLSLDRNSSSLSHHGSNHDLIRSRAHVLRTSSEERVYAYQRRLTSGVDVETSDPLALEALPVCDDETGAKGAFAVSHTHDGSTKAPSKGLRRVLKSFQRL